MKKLLILMLVLVLSVTLIPTASAASVPEEYVGEWMGSTGNINLSFTVAVDGAGSYTFEQSGYHESYDFSLLVDSETFSVQIPEDNKLGIVACEGTYAYSDGVLTLDVRTTMGSGMFEYTVPCKKVEPPKTADDAAAAASSAGAFPAECEVYGQPYTYTGYQIEVAEDGSTLVKIRGEGIVILKDPDGQNVGAISAVIEAGGEAYPLTWDSFTLHGSGAISELSTKPIEHDLVFKLSASAAPEKITLLNSETDEIVASFNVADEPQL